MDAKLVALKKLVDEKLVNQAYSVMMATKEELHEMVNTLLSKMKEVHEAVAGLNLGRQFKDEITHANTVVFDALAPVKKLAGLSGQAPPANAGEGDSLIGLIESSISTMQREFSLLENRAPDVLVEIESMQELVNTTLPRIHELLERQVEICTSVQEFNDDFDDLVDDIAVDLSGCMQVEAGAATLQDEVTKLTARLGEMEARNAELVATIASKDDEITALNEAHASMQERMAGEASKQLATKVAALESEVKLLMGLLEKSPRFQVLFAIASKSPTSIASLRRVAPFKGTMLDKVLADLVANGQVSIAGSGDDAVVELLVPLNPIGGITISDPTTAEALKQLKHGSIEDPGTITALLEAVDRHQDRDEHEIAGHVLATLLVHAVSSEARHSLQQILSKGGTLQENSFYYRVAMNLLHAYEDGNNASIVEDGIDSMPKLEIMNDDFSPATIDPTTGPFTIKKLDTLPSIQGKETPVVITGEKRVFETIDDVAAHAWLCSDGRPVKIEMETAAGNSVIIVAAGERPETVDLYTTKHVPGR